MRILRTLALATLLLPGCGFAAASKEMQELQRDVAQLQEQVRALQNTVDKQSAAMTAMVQQVLDASSKTSGAVTQLSGAVGEKLNQQLQTSLRPVAGVSTELHNVSNDTTELRSQVTELTAAVNKILQQLNDVNNAIRVMQAPAAAPPPSNTNSPAASSPNVSQGGVPPVQASTLWTNARRDYNGGKSEMALTGFQDFIRYYPNDPMAPQAQFFIGQIHFAGKQFDQSAQDYDAVLERYPENEITSQAQFMKGKSLVEGGKREAGIKEYKAVVVKYPASEAAKLAAAQLRALGVTAAAAPPASKARRR